MACFYLRPAWREKDPNENGRYPITFSKKGSQLDQDLMVPCGKCDGCRASARQDWSIRMYHEASANDRNAFLTLTYENAPEKLNKPDLQKFIKRLRYRSNREIRYFACGEYGEKTNRPHYHAIIFGEDFRGGAFDINDELYGNVLLDRIWTHGQVTAAEFNMSTACYVAGYVNKKIGDTDTFNIMSIRPPIGYHYAVQNQEQLARTEAVVIEGREYPVPKAYLNWDEPSYYRPWPVLLDTVRGNRQKYLIQRTPEELRNKEINLKAKQNLKDQKI